MLRILKYCLILISFNLYSNDNPDRDPNGEGVISFTEYSEHIYINEDIDSTVIFSISYETTLLEYNIVYETTLLNETLLSISENSNDLDQNNVTFMPYPNQTGTLDISMFVYVEVDGDTLVNDEGQIISDFITFQLTILEQNDSPYSESSIVLEINEDSILESSLNILDIENNELIFEILDQPTYGSLNNTNFPFISYTPNEHYFGSDVFTISIEDNGTSQQYNTETDSIEEYSDPLSSGPISIDIVILSVNDVPIYSSVPITNAFEDEIYEYEISASDVDGDQLSFNAITYPDWLELIDNENGTALLWGTPIDANSYDIEISVDDFWKTCDQFRGSMWNKNSDGSWHNTYLDIFK